MPTRIQSSNGPYGRVLRPADGKKVAYATLDDVMDLAEGLLSFLVKRCLEKRRADLQTVGRDLAKLEQVAPPFPRISYDEAVQKLQQGFAQGKLENKFEWGGDFGGGGPEDDGHRHGRKRDQGGPAR